MHSTAGDGWNHHHIRHVAVRMRAKKSLGQNFLMHAQTAQRIVQAAGVGKGDTVLEIGPGTGMLTRTLLEATNHVIAIEKDDELIPTLSDTFSQEIAGNRLTLIHGDALTFDTKSIAGPYRLVANIPYYITGEIIRTYLTAPHKPESVTLLVQKEVAERIARSKKESLLSLSVKAYGTPKYEFTVPRGAFKPAPSVDSAVLTVRDIRPDAFPSSEAESRFFAALRAGFAHKRKLLARNLEEIASKEHILSAFAAIPLSEKARAEDLTLHEWRIIAQMLSS